MRNLLSSKRPAGSPEQDLWIAVIFQALRDAARLRELEQRHEQWRTSGKPVLPYLERDLNEARKAMAWLTRPSRDLSLVCSLAGIEVDCLLARKELIESGELESFAELIATNE